MLRKADQQTIAIGVRDSRERLRSFTRCVRGHDRSYWSQNTGMGLFNRSGRIVDTRVQR